MQYRELGRTGWQVSDIRFGAWAIGASWGEVDDGDAGGAAPHRQTPPQPAGAINYPTGSGYGSQTVDLSLRSRERVHGRALHTLPPATRHSYLGQ